MSECRGEKSSGEGEWGVLGEVRKGLMEGDMEINS